VEQGNFMAMRRAAFVPRTPAGSAKLERLLQIVEESVENKLKIVIFTYFRDVLAAVHDAIESKFVENRIPATKIFGPISGSVTPTDRQQIIDEFTARLDHSVLISQIQAGGTGLNIQAASVVIICEPQVKPSLEAQAIARLHRMGQVRTVQSHRLLAAHSVDQRMVEMLSEKEEIFDEYARRSDIADGAPEAIDVSEAKLARIIVTEEQRRLFRKPTSLSMGQDGETGQQDS
jgi:SNF2 family DNA or RNA helicase